MIIDQGCFPFELLYDLHRRRVHTVFRLQTKSGTFMDGDRIKTVVKASFGRDAELKLRKRSGPANENGQRPVLQETSQMDARWNKR